MSSSTNVAAIFPGQGAQSVGMLGELAAEYPSIQARFAQASEVLGFDLWAMTQQGPAEVLSQQRTLSPPYWWQASRSGTYGHRLRRRQALCPVTASENIRPLSARVP